MGKIVVLNPYEELANAIVLQAVKDYRESNRKLARGRKNQEAQDIKEECLRFFQSNWYFVLTNVNPKFLIRRIDKEVQR